MPIIEIKQYISCVCRPEDLVDALTQGYTEIFIASYDGSFMKHSSLSHGRFIRMKVVTVPKEVKEAFQVVNEVKEEIGFLPAGKVPYIMLRQVIAFFKEVMKVKKADFEAQAFILWTPELGYHISVPKQTVSKAAVNFTYDEQSVPAGSVLVVDLHSHNTMGKCFS